jgi:hypothetical protein
MPRYFTVSSVRVEHADRLDRYQLAHEACWNVIVTMHIVPSRRRKAHLLAKQPGVGAPRGAPVRRRPHSSATPRAAWVKAGEAARGAGRSAAKSLDAGEPGGTRPSGDGERRPSSAPHLLTPPRSGTRHDQPGRQGDTPQGGHVTDHARHRAIYAPVRRSIVDFAADESMVTTSTIPCVSGCISTLGSATQRA